MNCREITLQIRSDIITKAEFYGSRQEFTNRPASCKAPVHSSMLLLHCNRTGIGVPFRFQLNVLCGRSENLSSSEIQKMRKVKTS